MKYWAYLLLLTIISCNNSQQKVVSSDATVSDTLTTFADTKNNIDKEICWIGTLNEKTPVFIHYQQLDSNIIVGEIKYLNTKDKLPITLLGTIEDDKSYRLLEFEKSGNITGIITGLPTENVFNGSWFSPKTRKELVLKLVKKDTVMLLPRIFGYNALVQEWMTILN